MAAVYSAVLFKANLGAPASFTIPSDEVWIIRCVTLFVGGPSSGMAQLVDHASGLLMYQRESSFFPLGGAFMVDADLRLVLEPGVTIDVTGNGNCNIFLHGYKLSSP